MSILNRTIVRPCCIPFAHLFILSVGGPLPIGWYQQQWSLQQQIVKAQTELGIGSILPAFQGNVPPVLKTLYPKVLRR